MAIWQFAFHIIPYEKGIKFSSADKKAQDIEEIMCWHGYTIKDCSVKELSKALSHNKSWSDDIKLFGTMEETCVELFYEDAILQDISIRLDLRSLTLDLLESVTNFAKSNDAVILRSDGFIIDPIVKEIIREIRKSDAF